MPVLAASCRLAAQVMLGVLLWLLSGAKGSVAFRPWGFATPTEMPLWVLAWGIAVAALLAAGLFWAAAAADSAALAARTLRLLETAAVAAAMLLLGGVAGGQLGASALVALVALLAAAAYAGWHLLRRLEAGDGVELRSQWGGLGGGLGGWRASPATVLLIVLLALAGGAIGVLGLSLAARPVQGAFVAAAGDH